MKRKAFTLIELLVVIAIIALLVSILLPSLNKVRELAKATMCMTQLNGIGKGLALYSAGNDDTFPGYGVTDASGVYEGFKTYASDGSDSSNCNANSYALLAKDGYVPYKMFICPAVDGKAAAPDSGQFGFESSEQISYGFQPASGSNVIGGDGGSNNISLSDNLGGSTVIAGDCPAETITGAGKANIASQNHYSSSKGQQNMLTLNGGVKKESYNSADTDKGAWGSCEEDYIFQINDDPAVGKSDSLLIYIKS